MLYDPPDPTLPHCDAAYNSMVTGIGGTGVITIGALLGMAAHMEGKASSILDMTGMSQRNGAAPLFTKRDTDGNPIKTEFGGWIFPVTRVLTALRFLRGTAMDHFGWTTERRMERSLVEQYMQIITYCLSSLIVENYEKWLRIASVPDRIRGYGHVKQASVDEALIRWKEMLSTIEAEGRSAVTAFA